MDRHFLQNVLLLLVVGLGGIWIVDAQQRSLALAARPVEGAPAERPSYWAVPIGRPGLSNLHQVSPGLYRGAQPTKQGIRELERLGVRTVINLRQFHSDRSLIGDGALAYETLRWMASSTPTDEQVLRFLKICSDPQRTPVFLHCQHGSDRTGTMTALYRMVVQGWSREQAIREMSQGGFGYHYWAFPHLLDYLRNVNVIELRRRAGIPSRPRHPDLAVAPIPGAATL